LMPNAVLAIAPSSGHRVPWEAEGWFSERVAEFLLAAK
jgi:pimeloyl-ACP methyl ester carboxylesterase